MTIAPSPVPHPSPHRLGIVVAAAALALAAGAVGVLIGRAAFGGSSSSSTVTGSGHAVVRARQVASFGAVELAGSVPVTVRIGTTRTVLVHGDDNLVSRITTRVEQGRLVVGTRPGSFETRAPMYVEVTAPSLSALTLSGSGVVTLDGIDARALTLALPGSGVVRASGKVDSLRVTLSGSGEAELGSLTARRVDASVSGSGMIAVRATDSLNASVSGSGAILYSGNPPHVLTNVTGSGAVTRIG